MKYIVGLLIIGLATVIVWKSRRLGEIFPISFAESKFAAGSVTFYQIVGISLIVLTFLFVFGILQGILRAIFT